MGASALGPWKASGSRTADDRRPGENLSSSSAERDFSMAC